MPIDIMETDIFENLRQGKSCYVDKTWFIEDFLTGAATPGTFRPRATASLFTRPRRFGKSLFLTMLASFFDIRKDSRELFAGLKIAENRRLCDEWMNGYPVVFLTLKDIIPGTYESIITSFKYLISDTYSMYTEVMNDESVDANSRTVIENILMNRFDEETLSDSLHTLTKILYQKYGKKVVVLIDEYDVPVAKACESGCFDDVLKFISVFLEKCLKDNPYLMFAILAGCRNIAGTGGYTGLNCLTCYDVTAERYSAM